MRASVIGGSVGSSVRRLEDLRLLTGQGQYVDDITVPGMLHAAFLRSPNPHALILRVDPTAARAAPGVAAVLTGDDITALTNPLMGMTGLPGLYEPWFWALAVDRVRHVGDPLAVVVADSRATAEDACELIDVEYEPLDPVVTQAEALDPDRNPLWPACPSANVLYDHTEELGDVDGAFATAEVVVRARFEQHRHSNQPMETRGLVAEVEPHGRLLVHASHQASHSLKWCLTMALARRPLAASAADLWRSRHRLHELGRATVRFLRQNPGIRAAQRGALPHTVRSYLREPRKAGWSVRMFAGLLSQGPAVQVRIPDVGGAFGTKGHMLREEVVVCAAARELGRAVKWIEDRNEHLICGGQAREESIEVEAAVTRNGVIRGLKVAMTMDQGAYPAFPVGAALYARLVRTMFPGPYRVPTMRFHSRILASNKATYVAYRGPWAMETFTRERLLDVVARELGITRAEVRLRNMLGPDELPNRMITGPRLDVRMSARTTLERALRLCEFDDWPKLQAEARERGKLVGLGIASYIEAAPGPPGYMSHAVPGFAEVVGSEPAVAVLEADGSISLHTQQVPHGQGQETTMAQVAADELGVRPEQIRLRFGDSRVAPFGLIGTGGSRSAAMFGGANALSARGLRTEILAVAAGLLEADPSDIEIDGAEVRVRGVPDAACTLREVADEARRRGIGPELETPTVGSEALRVARTWDGGEGGWAQATHVCWVEVDLETGMVAIPRYLVVEDCGEIINPAIVDGQIRGGVAQGVGAVLYEKSVYDEEGQMVTGTFMDYLIPTVSEIPPIEIEHVQTPSDIPFNYRGVGEGGMIGAPAAITNAIEDALADCGVRIREQHLPPSRLLELAGVIDCPGQIRPT